MTRNSEALHPAATKKPMQKPAGCGFRIAAAVCATMLLGLAGCTTTTVSTSDGRPMPPDPRPAPETPENALANRLVMSTTRPQDTNGNGYPDLIPVGVTLFAEPHATPVWRRGSFRFVVGGVKEVNEPDARPIAEWVLPPEEVQESRVRTMLGPGYSFSLSLLDNPSDRLPLIEVNLRGEFIPEEEGAPEVFSHVLQLQIGRGFVQQ